MIGSYQAFNQESIDSSQVYIGANNKTLVFRGKSSHDLKWDIDSVKSSFKALCRSLINVHREVCVIEDLSIIVELLTECFEKLKTECIRIGAVPKTVSLPKISASNLSMKFSLQQAAIAIKTTEALYKTLLNFFEKYNDEPFDLLNYVNMNRIGKAERLLGCAAERIRKLEKFSYLLRFHSLGLLFVCAARWIKKARISLPKRANMTLDLDEDSFREVNFPRKGLNDIDVDNDPDRSVPDPLFSATNEGNPDSMWPASPINTSFALEISLNSTITNFVSRIPKTLFTPDALSIRPGNNPSK